MYLRCTPFWKLKCLITDWRNLREMFKIDAADYMMSICGNDALRELSSPGKSGSVFFLSQDDHFMIKTLRKSEVKVCHLYWILCILYLLVMDKLHSAKDLFFNFIFFKFWWSLFTRTFFTELVHTSFAEITFCKEVFPPSF